MDEEALPALPSFAREAIALYIRPVPYLPICWSVALDMDPSSALRVAARCGNLARLRESQDRGGRDTTAINDAAERGHVECVRHLLPDVGTVNLDSALRAAIFRNNVDCARLLLPYCTDRLMNGLTLITAIQFGCTDIVKDLIPISDITRDDSEALRTAVQLGRASCVRELVPHCDVSDGWALNEAVRHGYTATARELLPHTDMTTVVWYPAISSAIERNDADCVALIAPYVTRHTLRAIYLSKALGCDHLPCMQAMLRQWATNADDREALVRIISSWPGKHLDYLVRLISAAGESVSTVAGDASAATEDASATTEDASAVTDDAPAATGCCVLM